MRILVDRFGRNVRLTDERLAHILEHPEMSGMQSQVEATVSRPMFVRTSRSCPDIQLLYNFFVETIVGGKWLCVVVKYEEADAFVVTAYLTNKPQAGEDS